MTSEPVPAPPAPPSGVYWKTFAVLMSLVLVAAVLVPALVVERLVLSAIAVAIGLYLGPRIGLDVSLIRSAFASEPRVGKRWLTLLPPSLIVGVAGGLTLLLAVPRLGEWLTPELGRDPDSGLTPVAPAAAWKIALASISAGVVEEAQFRLGMLTLIAWIGTRITGSARPGPCMLWMANLLAALAFALIHIRNVIALDLPLTLGLLVIIIASNGFAGLFFGWLYRCFGVESAMIAHVVLDMVLKVAGPFMIPNGL